MWLVWPLYHHWGRLVLEPRLMVELSVLAVYTAPSSSSHLWTNQHLREFNIYYLTLQPISAVPSYCKITYFVPMFWIRNLTVTNICWCGSPQSNLTKSTFVYLDHSRLKGNTKLKNFKDSESTFSLSILMTTIGWDTQWCTPCKPEIDTGCNNFLFSWLPGRASLAIKLLAQTCPNNKTVCVKLKSQNMSMVCN